MLYVVATPIGNAGELSPRAVEILRGVDLIAVEDTRVTVGLLHRFGIDRPLMPCHKFNETAAAERLTEKLLSGSSVALLCDAGTPCISDPGHILVAKAAEAGVAVTAVAGPSALAAALSVSGFPALSFSFYGFLPKEGKKIDGILTKAAQDSTPVAAFYISPHRLAQTLERIETRFPAARLCLCNDLTKRFERIYRGSPGAVLAETAANPNAGKGEYTLVLQKPPAAPVAEEPLTPEAFLVNAMARNGLSAKEAVAAGGPHTKKALYAAALRLKAWFGEGEA